MIMRLTCWGGGTDGAQQTDLAAPHPGRQDQHGGDHEHGGEQAEEGHGADELHAEEALVLDVLRLQLGPAFAGDHLTLVAEHLLRGGDDRAGVGSLVGDQCDGADTGLLPRGERLTEVVAGAVHGADDGELPSALCDVDGQVAAHGRAQGAVHHDLVRGARCAAGDQLVGRHPRAAPAVPGLQGALVGDGLAVLDRLGVEGAVHDGVGHARDVVESGHQRLGLGLAPRHPVLGAAVGVDGPLRQGQGGGAGVAGLDLGPGGVVDDQRGRDQGDADQEGDEGPEEAGPAFAYVREDQHHASSRAMWVAIAAALSPPE
jgi:hypothetical protein